MGLLDFLKKKKEEPKKVEKKDVEKDVEKDVKKDVKKEVKKPVKKEEKIKLEKKPKSEAGPRVKIKRKKVSDKTHKILLSPHITEKATGYEKENKYVFKILPEANKIEVKEAVEVIYGVDVVGVRVITVHRKKRKRGRYIGWKKGYKKAIVKVKEGQKIEILPR